MPHFKYLGDNASTFMFGKTFRKGVPVEIDDPKFVAKLRGNGHFAECEPGILDPMPPEEPATEPVSVSVAPAGDPNDDPSDDEPPSKPVRRSRRGK